MMQIVTAIEDLAEWLPPAGDGPADLGRLRERLAASSDRQVVLLRQGLQTQLNRLGGCPPPETIGDKS